MSSLLAILLNKNKHRHEEISELDPMVKGVKEKGWGGG